MRARTKSYSRLGIFLALALTAAPNTGRSSGAAGMVYLSEDRVFPGNDGAFPESLDKPLPELIEAWKVRTGKKKFKKRIVIHKARRRLDLYADETILKSYIVNLGLQPVGDKRRQGDMRTPEGDLFICTKNRASQFTRFLGLAYPTPASAREGVRSGKVGDRVEKAVALAYRRRDRCPPQNTPLGGAVGIHGSGGWDRRPGGYAIPDWTWGCVGLRDSDILEIFNGYAEVGVQVQIHAE